jgi:nicotinamidase-related amidase
MLMKTQIIAKKVPALHPQWSALDFVDILSLPTAWLAIGQSNSILSSSGAQSSEGLWERARKPGGSLENTLKLTSACHDAEVRVVWFRYEIFRDSYPGTAMDRAQWSHWTSGKNWSATERARDAELIDEVKAVMRPDDMELHYGTLGNVFLGTMLPNYLTMWGIRTVLLSGYHLDWCIEQAARTARDLGYMPIVVGDACGCGREEDETPTLERLSTFFAPVLSADTVIEHLGGSGRQYHDAAP